LAKQVYLDTNFVIRFIESEDFGLLRVIEDAAAGLLDLFTSELTLAEMLVGPLKADDAALAAQYEEFLTTDEFLEVVPIDRAILRESARIRALYGSRTPDAIHCATALRAECTSLLSSDSGFKMPPGLTRIALEDIASGL
jgi:predicted nucleic acid-binding protein